MCRPERATLETAACVARLTSPVKATSARDRAEVT
jgi:hypothetical protein